MRTSMAADNKMMDENKKNISVLQKSFFLLAVICFTLLAWNMLSFPLSKIRFYADNGEDTATYSSKPLLDDKDEIDWVAMSMESMPCISTGSGKAIDYYKNINCWQHFHNYNQNKSKVITPDHALCAFEPLHSNNYTRVGKKTVIIYLGVHLGPPADGKFSAPCGNLEFISWEYRDKDFEGLEQLLIHGFSKEHLLKTQQTFWEKFRDNEDLRRADIIACGFDTWHCLIFAPFNKKLLLNSAYRFDGHIGIGKEDQIELQKMYYQAIRYNPDVIMAGENIYDVMYHQHFFGSHKLIPLPATCDYVRQRMRNEILIDQCPGVPNTTTGYHPESPLIIAISPSRLSGGGALVAKEMMNYFNSSKTKYEIVILSEHMKHPYRYCDIGKYAAFIVLGYSVMSYFNCECASLGIPMFVPSPRLYAEFERKYHLISERKGPLDHTTFDYMKQNPRSLNYGYNPNDDFNMTYLTRWVGYADYFAYKSTQFDDYDDLFKKIQNCDLKKMNENMVKERAINAVRTQDHWKTIDRYFHGNEDVDVIPVTSSELPHDLNEGYRIWEEKIQRPNFDQDKTNTLSKNSLSKVWLILNLHDYLIDFEVLPECNSSQIYNLVFYGKVDIFPKATNNCTLYNVNALEPTENNRFSLYMDLIVLLNITSNNPFKIIILQKIESGCRVSEDYAAKIVNFSRKWSQKTFYPQQYFLAWLPVDDTILEYYLSTLKRLTTTQFPEVCSLLSSKNKKYTENEILYLQDYLKYWVTDEISNFFHVIDQLNFELAVKGYVTKSDAIVHRKWMQHLSACKISVLPTYTYQHY